MLNEMNNENAELHDLQRIYRQRFSDMQEYRSQIWNIINREFFIKWISRESKLIDVGCGYGEFINNIDAAQKIAIDLNPDAINYLDKDIRFVHQDCSESWPSITSNADCIFSSNFFEHLPSKKLLGKTLDNAFVALKNGGVFIAMGPNVRCIPGQYWDFWDHYLPLTEKSLSEALSNRGFNIVYSIGRFLPYTMSGKTNIPLLFVKLYLRMPFLWPFLGANF